MAVIYLYIPLSYIISAIREYDAKLLLAYWLERAPPVAPHAQVKTKFNYPAPKVAQVSWDPETNSITPDSKLPSWVFTTKLVAKPDQLIKRRGKAGLLALNKTWDEAKAWISERAGKPQKVRVSAALHTYDPDLYRGDHNLPYLIAFISSHLLLFSGTHFDAFISFSSIHPRDTFF